MAIPPALPPAEHLYNDAIVFQKLAEASRKLAELKGIASMLPNQSIFVNTIALREAKASSAIENFFTTDDELYKALTYHGDDYVQGPAKEILHYREALWKGYAEMLNAGKTGLGFIDRRDGIYTAQRDTFNLSGKRAVSRTKSHNFTFCPEKGRYSGRNDKLFSNIAATDSQRRHWLTKILK